MYTLVQVQHCFSGSSGGEKSAGATPAGLAHSDEQQAADSGPPLAAQNSHVLPHRQSPVLRAGGRARSSRKAAVVKGGEERTGWV